MIKIELLYFKDCPTYQSAYELLQEVLQEMRISCPIELVPVHSEEEAIQRKFYGSPSIRINGEDLESKTEPRYGFGCRIYKTQEGLRGWPDKSLIYQNLEKLNDHR